MANRNFSRAMRRKTQWAGFGNETGAALLPVVIQLTANIAQIISQNAVIAGGLGFVDEEVTITRMIGNLIAGVRIATAEADSTIAVGCVVARVEAIAAGVASLPSPEDDPDAEWLYYGVFPTVNQVASQIAADGASAWKQSFDVRGQRVVRAGSSLVWLAESQTNAAFVGVGGRYLGKLT